MAKKQAKNNIPGLVSITDIVIKDFLNRDLKDFAMYVLQSRALPSAMDGLRIGARKIVWAALKGKLSKSKSYQKLPTFIGEAMGFKYAHGDASIKNTTEQLCMSHVSRLHPLSIIGQIASLRSGKVNTAARYLSIEASKNLDVFRADNELLTILNEEGEDIEPKYFLPIIPFLLTYRTNSPGFGFSYRCMSYSIDSIIDNCIQAILHGSCKLGLDTHQLIPDIAGIKRENFVYNSNRECWFNVGEYYVDKEHDFVSIYDLPYNIQFENYETYLMGLAEKGLIKSFQNFSMDGKIHYKVEFFKGALQKLNRLDLYKRLKLVTKISPDIINVIAPNQKTILFFEDAYEYIDWFVKARLEYYEKRKVKTIALLELRIAELKEINKFIQLVIDGKLEIRNVPIADIKARLDKEGIRHSVLRLNISKLTKDEIAEHLQEIADNEAQLEYIKNTTIEEMYVKELVEFKANYSSIINK